MEVTIMLSGALRHTSNPMSALVSDYPGPSLALAYLEVVNSGTLPHVSHTPACRRLTEGVTCLQSARGRMTGTVIDSGAGCTHVIPVSDGFVIGSAIQSMPIAGRDLTKLVQRLMRWPDAALLPA